MSCFRGSLLAFIAFTFYCLASFSIEPVDRVNPFIGSANYGTTNPGPVLPNGMMSVSPFNVMGSELNKFDKDKQWWSTPYTSENKFFTGYSHVNLSGVGCPELGSLLLMATAGDLNVNYEEYGSEYINEVASPGYYSNLLTKYNIKTEVSATTRTSIARFTFPEGEANILLNLGEGLTNESGAWMRRVSDTEVEGMKMLGTFCYNPDAVFPIYFVMRVNKVPVTAGYWKMQREMGVEAQWDSTSATRKLYTRYNRDIAGDDIGAYFTYSLEQGETIEVQIGVSFVSTENARMNLDAEQKGFDFDLVRNSAHDEWNKALSKVAVSGGTDEQQTVFYTGLYHALIHPNILNDVNGEYPMMEGDEILSTENDRYTVFSLWDTYRNVHQLLTLLYPEIQLDMVRSMIDMYKESDWLPRWELYSRETLTMEGDPAIPVIVDSWMKDCVILMLKLLMRQCTNRKFVNRLQEVFIDGHYDPTNEPNIGYPFLFSYIKGEEWRTQKLTQELLAKHFRNSPDGLPGNDDTGTMSTWALFSMMGFYPDDATDPSYTFTTPVFDKVILNLDDFHYNGHTIEIETVRPSADAIYIDKIEIDGKPFRNFRISHDVLIKADKITFYLKER